MHNIGLVLFIFFNLYLLTVNTDGPTSYAGFRVYEVIMDKQNATYMSLPGVSILSESRLYRKGKPYFVCSYLVPGDNEEIFRRALGAVDAMYFMPISDLGKLIQEEKEGIARRRSSDVGYDSKIYLSYNEMVDYLAHISQITNPDNGEPLAEIEKIGNSYEGRTLFGVRISSEHRQQKPIMIFEAGTHAREWTALSAALYMIHQLVANYTHNAHVLRDVDIYILPLSNPDGYEYSRLKDRLWRKTRSFQASGDYGVDMNRNFGYHWGEIGASSDPSSHIYKGRYPFSEPETRSIRDVGKTYEHRLVAFVSIHAYGSCIVYPWGYTKAIEAPDTPLMRNVAKKASEKIRKFSGSNYEFGQSSILLSIRIDDPTCYRMFTKKNIWRYEFNRDANGKWIRKNDSVKFSIEENVITEEFLDKSAGGSDDYFKGVFRVPLTYTIELSSRGTHSFIVPPENVPSIVAEAYEGFKVVAQCAAEYEIK